MLRLPIKSCDPALASSRVRSPVHIGVQLLAAVFAVTAATTGAGAQEQSASGVAASEGQNEEHVRELLRAGAKAYRRGDLKNAYEAFRAAC